jgi:hypothetical protein
MDVAGTGRDYYNLNYNYYNLNDSKNKDVDDFINDSIILRDESYDESYTDESCLESLIKRCPELNPHILHDFKVLDQLTSGQKLCVVQDENKKNHLQIAWFATNTIMGQLLQPTCRFVHNTLIGGSNRVDVVQHLLTLLKNDYDALINALDCSTEHTEAWKTVKEYIDLIKPKIRILADQYLKPSLISPANFKMREVETAYDNMNQRWENAIIERGKRYLQSDDREKAMEFFKMCPNRLEDYNSLYKIICAAPTGHDCDALIDQLSEWASAKENTHEKTQQWLQSIKTKLASDRSILQDLAGKPLFNEDEARAKFNRITYPLCVICADSDDLLARGFSILARLYPPVIFEQESSIDIDL